uniref:Disease resistance protein At4g27190-like leucine-rich repeats domain-containing protein n=1 Tax=Fagus sylvatica TaxID=28930 RepID=A0A2N9FYA6_FAGSY
MLQVKTVDGSQGVQQSGRPAKGNEVIGSGTWFGAGLEGSDAFVSPGVVRSWGTWGVYGPSSGRWWLVRAWCWATLRGLHPRDSRRTPVLGVNPVVSEVLAETDAFGLIGHKGASRLSDFGMENINRMRVCLIEGCDEIETIVHGNSVDRSALEWLQKMFINNAQKLESIWEGPVHAGSLAQLTTLTLQRCPKLKKIFSNGMIEQLFKLEHLSVEECPEIEEIITNSENTGLEPEALPKLRTLVLSGLLKVESICTDDSLKWPALERITISRCQLLTRLPLNKDNAPYLRRIEGDQSWWTALEWKEDAIKGRFESFFKSN